MDSTAKPKKPRRKRYVLKRKDGSRAYPVRYTKPDGTTGQETFDTAEAADEFRVKIRAAKRMGVKVNTRRTIAEVAREWAAKYVRHQEDKTQLMHIGNLTNRMLPWAGAMRLATWTRETTGDYIDWLRERGDVRLCRREDGSQYGRWDVVPVDHPARRPAGAATIRQAVQTGSLVMQHAMDKGLRVDNPFAGAKRPREQAAQRRALTLRELVLIGRACEALGKEQARALILMRAHTGIRMQDARALEWRDVDLKAGWVTVRRAADHRGKVKSTKSGKEDHGRRTPLRGLGLAAMREWHDAAPAARGLVFWHVGARRERKILNPSNWRRDEWLPILAAAGRGLAWELAGEGVAEDDARAQVASLLKVVPHELRHTFPSLVSASGEVPMAVAMAWGGWRSPAMWKRYEHLYDEVSERAADSLGAWLDSTP